VVLRVWILVATLLASLFAGASSANDPFLRRTPTVLAVEKVGPAVVNITTETVVQQPSPFPGFQRHPLFEQYFRGFPMRERTVSSLGSGVLIDEQGHVLTNEHVIRSATRIRVVLGDAREFDAEVIGADPNTDLAVLRIETDEALPWVQPGSSSDLLVGEPVIAIGNPFGLSNTVTTGVLSATNRSIGSDEGGHVFHGFLQTDASINPGNSGGPLLNAEGSLIGINSAIYNGAEGIGFAIPIDTATRVVTELIEHGEIQPVWVGLRFQTLDPALHEVMELPDGVSGALVSGVKPRGPGRAARVKRGDIVTQVDGHAVSSPEEFYELLKTVTAGQELEFGIWRDSKAIKLYVYAEEIPDSLIPQLSQELLGMILEPNARGGFRVLGVRPDSHAAQIGIRRSDLLLRVNARPLNGEDDLRRALLGLRGRSRALLVVQRGGGRYHVALRLT
jgi:serine protease Do